MAIRVLTYNLFDGGSTHGGRLELIRGILQRVQPDVIGLQECNGFLDGGGRTLFDLEHTLGMRSIVCETRTGYHLALFVRGGRVLEAHTPTDWFHHGALRAKLRFATGDLTVIVAHLCPFSGESRVREAQYLATHVRDERVVVMGDMNSISRRDLSQLDLQGMLPFRRSRHFVPGTEDVDTRAMAVLESANLVDLFRTAHPDTLGATLPTPLVEGTPVPELRVDYLFGTPTVAQGLRRCEVLVDEETKRASDHFPLLAELDL